MPSPAFADDDTALRCSGPSDWNPRIWDWVVENDVDEAGRIYHDEKPRIRGRHRDSKRHGARGVDAYSETITVFDVQQTSWYSRGTNAPVFLRIRWTNPSSRDANSMTHGVEYSVAKKKRWRIVEELSQNIERYQNPDSGLRTTLVLEYQTQAWKSHVESDLISVDDAGHASRRIRPVDWMSAVQDLSGIPLREYRCCEPQDNSDALKSRGKRRSPLVKQRHIVYHAVEYRISNHQFNTTEKRTRKDTWDHPSLFVGGSKRYHPTRHRGRRQAWNKLDLKEDVCFAPNDRVGSCECETDANGISPRRAHFSLSDFVTNERNAMKATVRMTTPSPTFDEWVVVDDMLCASQSDPSRLHSADACYRGKMQQATRHPSGDSLSFEWVESSPEFGDF